MHWSSTALSVLRWFFFPHTAEWATGGDPRRPEEPVPRAAHGAAAAQCRVRNCRMRKLRNAEAAQWRPRRAECRVRNAAYRSCGMVPASCGRYGSPPRACQDRHGHAAACSDRQGCAAASPHRTAVAACPPAPSRVQGAGRAGGAGRCMLPHSYHSSRWKSAQGAGRRVQGAAMLPHSYHSSRWKSAQNLQFCRESPGGGPSAGPPR